MRGEVPSGWALEQLGPLVDVLSGFAFPSTKFVDDPAAGLPLIRIRDLETHSPATYFSGEYDSRYVIRHGDVLVGMDGDFHVAGWTGPDSLLNQRVCRVGSGSPKLHSGFLRYRLVPLIAKIHSETAATTVKHLSTKSIHKASIPLPPLPEQRKIAAILSSVDEAIAATEAVIAQTRRVKEGLLQDLLTRGIGHTRFKQTEIGEIPESWEVRRLGDVIEHFDSGWSPICDSQPALAYEWAILKTTAVVWDGYTPSSNKRLPSSLQPRVAAEVLADDILITRKGPLDRVGVVVHVDATPPMRMIPDTVIRIRITGDNGLEPAFVALALGSIGVQHDWHGKKVGLASAQVNINRTIINGTKIPMPPIREQQAIVGASRQYRDVLAVQRAQLAALRETKAGLLQDLLTGKVRVSV